jgi:hypothetical protein
MVISLASVLSSEKDDCQSKMAGHLKTRQKLYPKNGHLNTREFGFQLVTVLPKKFRTFIVIFNQYFFLFQAPEMMYASLDLPGMVQEATKDLPDHLIKDCFSNILVTGNFDTATFQSPSKALKFLLQICR